VLRAVGKTNGNDDNSKLATATGTVRFSAVTTAPSVEALVKEAAVPSRTAEAVLVHADIMFAGEFSPGGSGYALQLHKNGDTVHLGPTRGGSGRVAAVAGEAATGARKEAPASQRWKGAVRKRSTPRQGRK